MYPFRTQEPRASVAWQTKRPAKEAKADARTRGDEDEAERYLRMSEESAGAGDWITHSLLNSVRAPLLMRRGAVDEALGKAVEALALTEGSDDIEAQGLRSLELAEMLARAGRTTEAAECFEKAASLLEQKGVVWGAERAREELARLGANSRP
jgi:tetratricopeptide (TPR) repeat protein